MLKGLVDSVKANDSSSSTRFIMYATSAVILFTYFFHNIMSAINGEGFVDFPTNSVAVLGIVLTGKVAQKFAEIKEKDKIV